MRRYLIFLCSVAILGLVASSSAIENPGTVKNELEVIERIGKQLDTTLRFQTSNGEEVSLGELFLEGRPLIIIPVYYSCPRLCGLSLRGLHQSLIELDLTLGQDYTVAAVSFDSTEGPALAAKRAKTYREGLGDHSDHWYFLTGEPQPVDTLMKSIGFPYKEDNGEFAHSAAFMVVTPEGVLSRYFYGVMHDNVNVRRALIEAADGAIGSAFDKVFLFCFRYDHITGQYSLAVINLARLVGAVTVVGLLLLVLYLRSKERKTPNAPGVT